MRQPRLLSVGADGGGAFRPTYWDRYTAAIVVIEVLLALEHLVALRERKVVETWHHGRDAHAVANRRNVKIVQIFILTEGADEDIYCPANTGLAGKFLHLSTDAHRLTRLCAKLRLVSRH